MRVLNRPIAILDNYIFGKRQFNFFSAISSFQRSPLRTKAIWKGQISWIFGQRTAGSVSQSWPPISPSAYSPWPWWTDLLIPPGRHFHQVHRRTAPKSWNHSFFRLPEPTPPNGRSREYSTEVCPSY